MDSEPATTDSMIAKVRAMPSPPVAIQGLWDGDTFGWILFLDAVLESGLALHIVSLRQANQVEIATRLGAQLATHFGVPWWLASAAPDLDAPGWLDRNGDRMCADCGETLALQTVRELPNDICEPCRKTRHHRQRLRDDTPVDASRVSVTCNGYSASTSVVSDPVAKFALVLDRHRAETMDEVVIAGGDLAGLEVALVTHTRELVDAYDRGLRLPVTKHAKHYIFEGRTLALHNVLPIEFQLRSALRVLEQCRQGFELHVVFAHRMTARMGHILDLVRKTGANITSLCKACHDDLDEAQARDAIDRLVALDHVTVDDNVVRATKKGRHASTSPVFQAS